MNSKTVEELEHRQLHNKFLRKYGGCLLTINDMGRLNTPHEDVSVTIAATKVEYKHEYYDSPNLCLELIANIPYEDPCFERSPDPGETFDWHSCHDDWYNDLLTRSQANSAKKRKGEKVKGPTCGLLNAALMTAFTGGNHVTQYIRAWPGVDGVGVEKATLYYFDTKKLQQLKFTAVWEHRFTDPKHNPSWTCLSVLVPVTSTSVQSAVIAEYDITAEYREYDAEIRKRNELKDAQNKARLDAILN